MQKFILVIIIPCLYLLFFPIVIFFRSAPGVNFLVLALIAISLSYIGLFLWIGGMISLGSSFGVLPEKKKRVTRGLYKYLHHPIYSGIFLTFFGLALALGSGWGLLYDLFILLPLFLFRAKQEEKLLH